MPLNDRAASTPFASSKKLSPINPIRKNIPVARIAIDLTHLYDRVTPEEEKVFGLERLKDEARKIAEIAGLSFFSTEIAIVDRETFVVVDYVNDQCDMRLKSRFPDGVPDDVVDEIAVEIARYAQERISLMPRVLKLAEGSGGRLSG